MGTQGSARDKNASPWGWIALGAVVASIVGYVVQSIFDYVTAPAIVGQISFYGLFGAPAIVALVAGAVAVVTGWKRHDHTVRFGLVGMVYFVLAQTVQVSWDLAGGETDLTVIATYVVAGLTAVSVVLLRRLARRPI
jgi:branched-subunit amino acid transport protein